MKYAVLAVVLAAMQTSPPVPRQTADGSAQSGAQAASKTHSKNARSAKPPAIQDAPSAPRGKNKAGYVNSPNAKQTVSISELPTVSVDVKKDWLDKTAWFFGLALVGIGVFGVRAAYRTLKAIESQTEHLVKSERAWVQVPEIIVRQKLSFVT